MPVRDIYAKKLSRKLSTASKTIYLMGVDQDGTVRQGFGVEHSPIQTYDSLDELFAMRDWAQRATAMFDAAESDSLGE